MNHLLFGFIAVCWAWLSIHSAMRFVRRRRPESLVIAVGFIGWPVLAMRELHRLDRLPTTALLAAAAACGLLGVLITYHYGGQRP